MKKLLIVSLLPLASFSAGNTFKHPSCGATVLESYDLNYHDLMISDAKVRATLSKKGMTSSNNVVADEQIPLKEQIEAKRKEAFDQKLIFGHFHVIAKSKGTPSCSLSVTITYNVGGAFMSSTVSKTKSVSGRSLESLCNAVIADVEKDLPTCEVGQSNLF
jgi:hypothetical protein